MPMSHTHTQSHSNQTRGLEIGCIEFQSDRTIYTMTCETMRQNNGNANGVHFAPFGRDQRIYVISLDNETKIEYHMLPLIHTV